MPGSIFKKTISISIFAHIAVFSMFTVSLGPKIIKQNYPQVVFFGQVLNNNTNYLLSAAPNSIHEATINLNNNSIFMQETNSLREKCNIGMILNPATYALKPNFMIELDIKKASFKYSSQMVAPNVLRPNPAIIFHPILPFGFNIYFQDRQIAHVELMFKVISSGMRKAILVKRKVSSGNLDVDLLSSRYIEHYLFIKQNNFITGEWLTVKIDLAARGN